MAKNVRVLDLLINPEKYGDATRLYIDYKPDKKQIELAGKRTTGASYPQKFETEKNMAWRLLLYSHKKVVKAYLLGYVTNAKLGLRGEVGFKNGIRCMNNICKECYSNKELGLKAEPITMKIWDYAESDVKYSYYSKRFYLAEKTKFSDRANCISWGFYVTGKGGLESCATLREFTYLVKEETLIEFSVVPIIPLPDDMMVRIEDPKKDGSTPEKGLELVLPYKESVEEKDEGSETIMTSNGIDLQALENYALNMLENAKSMERKANDILENVKKLKENKT